MYDQEKEEPVTLCMYIYKAKPRYDGSLDKLKFKTVIRGYMQNK